MNQRFVKPAFSEFQQGLADKGLYALILKYAVRSKSIFVLSEYAEEGRTASAHESGRCAAGYEPLLELGYIRPFRYDHIFKIVLQMSLRYLSVKEIIEDIRYSPVVFRPGPYVFIYFLVSLRCRDPASGTHKEDCI